MSGGHFNSNGYIYHQMFDFADQLESELQSKDFNTHYNEKTIAKLKRELIRIRECAEVMKKIDYLFSGDIGEETFLRENQDI